MHGMTASESFRENLIANMVAVKTKVSAWSQHREELSTALRSRCIHGYLLLQFKKAITTGLETFQLLTTSGVRYSMGCGSMHHIISSFPHWKIFLHTRYMTASLLVQSIRSYGTITPVIGTRPRWCYTTLRYIACEGYFTIALVHVQGSGRTVNTGWTIFAWLRSLQLLLGVKQFLNKPLGHLEAAIFWNESNTTSETLYWMP